MMEWNVVCIIKSMVFNFDTNISTGFSLCSIEEEGLRRLYVNSVKETGLAFKKGMIGRKLFSYLITY